MSAAFPDPTTSDIIKTWLTGFKNHVLGILNSFNGANIRGGTVPLSALQAQYSLHAITLPYQGNLAAGAASVANVFGTIRLPNFSSSPGSFGLVSYSIGHRTGTPQTGNSLLVKKNGSTIATLDIGLLAAGTGTKGDFANLSLASDDELEIDYTYNNPGTPPVYTDLVLVLWLKQFHL